MADLTLELPEGVPPMTQYYVYLTGGCNLACQHCWITPTYQAKGGTGGHLGYDLFALAINEGVPLGLRSVKLTGGEPLLHPDFIRIVDLLQEKELGLVIETNGTLMTKSLAKYLKEKSTLTDISVSLDGSKAETHDPFRGVKGSFDKAVLGLKNLVENGYHPQIIMSIHKGNVDEIEALVKQAEGWSAGSVKFNLIQPMGRGKTMIERHQLLNIKELIELGNWVENDLQKRISIPLHYSWPMAFYSIHRLLGSLDHCGIFNIMGVLATGQFAMCGIGIEVPELCYGQLGKDRLDDVWRDQPTLLALRRDLPGNFEGICGNCIFKQDCLGSCVANNYHQGARLTQAFWFCQEALENGLFPVGRLQKQTGIS